MYIHGFIDGFLAALVLGIAVFVTAAVIYARKKK